MQFALRFELTQPMLRPERKSTLQFHLLDLLRWLQCLWLYAIITAHAAAPQFLQISEFCAANINTISDDTGAFSDWIELHNPTDRPYDLSDYCLTDDSHQPKKFRLPSALLLPGERAIVFASGRINERSELPFHLPFKLSSAGEYLGLVFNASGETVHEFAPRYPRQVPGLSYGIVRPTGQDLAQENNPRFDFLAEPTPGKPNSLRHSDPWAEAVPPPEFSKRRGFFDQPFLLSLSSNLPGATIIYTTDGAVPTTDQGIRYTGPVEISQSKVVRAIAVKDGTSSRVRTHSYLFLSQVSQQTRPTNLPKNWADVMGDYDMDRRITEDQKHRDQIVPSLRSLPTLSLATRPEYLFDDEIGIYSHPEEQGIQWERPVSFEWIEGERRMLQMDAGLRIQGAWFRGSKVTRKHSFRLLFKRQYGQANLNYDLFEEFGATDRFNSLVLRAGGNDGYSWDQAKGIEQFIRDEFGRRLSLAFGQPAPRGRFVHVYLNGLYWGIYNLCERPDEAFSAAYLGGAAEQWDAINSGTPKNGNLDAWTRVIHAMSRIKSLENYLAVQGLDATGQLDERLPRFLNTTHYVDYLLANIWVGNADWPDKNYWMGWYHGTPSQGFRLYSWDLEVSLGNSRERSPLEYQAPQRDSIRSGSTEPHFWLRSVPEYQIDFADRVYRHLSRSGPLSIRSMREHYRRWADEIEPALIAEIARWGDDQFPTPRSLGDWHREKEWILNHYLLRRGDIVLEQLKNSGLYPRLAPPQITPESGVAERNQTVWLSGIAEEIYYTFDGSDPRLPGGDVNPTAVKMEPDSTFNLPTEYYLIGEKSVWRYATAGIRNQTDWESIHSPETVTWKAGLAPLGQESKQIKTTVARTLPPKIQPSAIPLVFKKSFSLTPPKPIKHLEMWLNCSDAVTVLINQEIVYRTDPLPPRPYSLLAKENTNPLTIQIPAQGIVAGGKNEVLVFVHQRSALDTTTHFDLSLKAITQGNNKLLFRAPLDTRMPIQLLARAFDGRKWSPLLDVDLMRDVQVPTPGVVQISELGFRPRPQLSVSERAMTRDPIDFQFLKVTNQSNRPVDLSGSRLEEGVEFEFPRRTVLPAHESVFVVRNQSCFETRYSQAQPIIGQFEGRLSRRGERISLRTKNGILIESFRYRTDGTWPIQGEASGVALVRRPDAANEDPDHPSNWEQRALGPMTKAASSTEN